MTSRRIAGPRSPPLTRVGLSRDWECSGARDASSIDIQAEGFALSVEKAVAVAPHEGSS
jgi:hypothetical protein